MNTEKKSSAAEKTAVKKWGRKLEAFAAARRRDLRFDCALDEIGHKELRLMNEAARAAFDSLLSLADSHLLRLVGVQAFEYAEITKGAELEKLAEIIEGNLCFPVSAIWRQTWKDRLKSNMQRFRQCALKTPDYLGLED